MARIIQCVHEYESSWYNVRKGFCRGPISPGIPERSRKPAGHGGGGARYRDIINNGRDHLRRKRRYVLCPYVFESRAPRTSPRRVYGGRRRLRAFDRNTRSDPFLLDHYLLSCGFFSFSPPTPIHAVFASYTCIRGRVCTRAYPPIYTYIIYIYCVFFSL